MFNKKSDLGDVIAANISALQGDVSNREFARICDIPESNLRNYLKGKGTSCIEGLLKISKSKNVTLDYLTGAQKETAPIDSSPAKTFYISDSTIKTCIRKMLESQRADRLGLMGKYKNLSGDWVCDSIPNHEAVSVNRNLTRATYHALKLLGHLHRDRIIRSNDDIQELLEFIFRGVNEKTLGNALYIRYKDSLDIINANKDYQRQEITKGYIKSLVDHFLSMVSGYPYINSIERMCASFMLNRHNSLAVKICSQFDSYTNISPYDAYLYSEMKEILITSLFICDYLKVNNLLVQQKNYSIKEIHHAAKDLSECITSKAFEGAVSKLDHTTEELLRFTRASFRIDTELYDEEDQILLKKLLNDVYG